MQRRRTRLTNRASKHDSWQPEGTTTRQGKGGSCPLICIPSLGFTLKDKTKRDKKTRSRLEITLYIEDTTIERRGPLMTVTSPVKHSPAVVFIDKKVGHESHKKERRTFSNVFSHVHEM